MIMMTMQMVLDKQAKEQLTLNVSVMGDGE